MTAMKSTRLQALLVRRQSIDLGTGDRAREVLDYAAARRISVADAVLALVDGGLDRMWETAPAGTP